MPTVPVPDDFAGVVSVSVRADIEFEQAYGLADRAHGVPFEPGMRFAMASGTKAFTAVAVLSLILEGTLSLDSPVRPALGSDLRLISDDVTVRHLLTHTSGIGDYCDEDLPEEEWSQVPVQTLESTEDYVAALDGFATKFPAGATFSYCNSGYVLLALVAERVSGSPFAELLAERVFAPAGMHSTGFLRSDELPGDVALGYLDDGRTNVFKLPVVGSGDGGAYTTVADVRAFWAALFGGGLDARYASWMAAPGRFPTGTPYGYGMGLWLVPAGTAVFLEGCDNGVSFRSWHDPVSGRTATVANTTAGGAWPVARALGATYFDVTTGAP